MDDYMLQFFFAAAFILLMCGVMAITGCTDPDAATRILKANGMTNVEMTGWQFAACGNGDWYATGFRAKTITGATVTGTVCEGLWFKAQTIRFD